MAAVSVVLLLPPETTASSRAYCGGVNDAVVSVPVPEPVATAGVDPSSAMAIMGQ
jgi:hypothetical protein